MFTICIFYGKTNSFAKFFRFLRFSQIQLSGGKICNWYIILPYFTKHSTPMLNSGPRTYRIGKYKGQNSLCELVTAIRVSLNYSMHTAHTRVPIMKNTRLHLPSRASLIPNLENCIPSYAHHRTPVYIIRQQAPLNSIYKWVQSLNEIKFGLFFYTSTDSQDIFSLSISHHYI